MAKRKKSDFTNQDLDENINTESVQDDNPLLQQPVMERDYSGGDNFEIRGDVVDSVEEPETKKPIVDFNEDSDDGDFDDDFDDSDDGSDDDSNDSDNDIDDTDDDEDSGRGAKVSENGGEKYIEDFDEMSPKMQNELTGNLANTCVSGYTLIHNFAKQILKRDRGHYQQKAMEGKFDMNVLSFKVDMGDGQYSRFGDNLEYYNNVIDELLTVKDETLSEMKTLIKRIAKKHGVGQSDESRLLFLVGTDLFTKTALLTAQVRQMNRVEANVTKMYHASLGRQRVVPVNAQPQPQQQQQPQAQQMQPQQQAQQTTAQPQNTVQNNAQPQQPQAQVEPINTPPQQQIEKTFNDVTEAGE